MAAAGLSRFLTTWFTLDAILNGGCAVAYFLFPASFFAGIGGPHGDDVTPTLAWVVRTQAGYFALAAGAMLTAARSRDPLTRRYLAAAFTVPAIWLIPAAIIRGSEGDEGGAQIMAQSCIITAVVCAPYLWFTVVTHEEKAHVA